MTLNWREDSDCLESNAVISEITSWELETSVYWSVYYISICLSIFQSSICYLYYFSSSCHLHYLSLSSTCHLYNLPSLSSIH